MDKHLLSRIKSKYQHLSKGQKLIADFIGEHYDEAAFMTASKLGETVGVSESTVVRFACELGYGGYPKLQKAMQEMIRDKLTSVQRIDVTCERIGGGDVLDSVLNQDIEKIRRTIEETSREDFNNTKKQYAGMIYEYNISLANLEIAMHTHVDNLHEKAELPEEHDGLGNDRGQRCSSDTHGKSKDKNRIQNNISHCTDNYGHHADP